MNIFVLDKDPQLAAQYHCDKHVVKMVLETAQIISTALKGNKIYNALGLYKPTHANHPCVRWAMDNNNNLHWLLTFGVCLSKEYTHRYGKEHKSAEIIFKVSRAFMNLHWDVGFTEPKSFVKCVPEKYRYLPAVEAYKKYYLEEKAKFAKYTNRKLPHFMDSDWLQSPCNYDLKATEKYKDESSFFISSFSQSIFDPRGKTVGSVNLPAIPTNVKLGSEGETKLTLQKDTEFHDDYRKKVFKVTSGTTVTVRYDAICGKSKNVNKN